MDFSKALEALKAGKKVTRPVFNGKSLTKCKLLDVFEFEYEIKEYKLSCCDVLAEDWVIIEDIPEIKLFRSKEIRLECPKCGRESEQIVYQEDKKETIHECRYCGQKYRFSNLDEMKQMYYGDNKQKSFEDLLKEYNLLDIWKYETKKVLEADDVWVSWSNYTKEEAKRIVDKTIKDYEDTKRIL